MEVSAMPRYAPRTSLSTHEVTNQPPEFAPRNLYPTDPVLREAALREAAIWVDAPLAALGEAVGSEQVLEWGELANRHPPGTRHPRPLRAADRRSAVSSRLSRADEVRDRHGLHSSPGRRSARRACGARRALPLYTEVEAGHGCPITMTFAATPASGTSRDLAAQWLPKILAASTTRRSVPIAEKQGVTIGMAMTEKQGGSDVRANTTRADPVGGEAGRPTTGRPQVLRLGADVRRVSRARPGAGRPHLLPRAALAPDGSRNPLQIMRLKRKMGNVSNASSEIGATRRARRDGRARRAGACRRSSRWSP